MAIKRLLFFILIIFLFTQTIAVPNHLNKRSERPVTKNLKYVQKQSPFKHYSIKGYNCSDFLRINDLSRCCEGRNDDCYMNRDNTRCYCDEFCVEKYATHNDCCPDAIQQCVFEHVNSPYIYKPKQDTERSLEEPNEPTTGSNLILEMRSSLRFVVLNETNKDKSKNNYNHGNKENELYGGSCSEFFKLNNMMTCCSNRNDECYMKHYTTRCYCDEFCDRRPNSSDCCVDAFQKCFTSSNFL